MLTHDVPPSGDICTFPSSVPAQERPGFFGDSENE
jgi:hypothetical protein